MECKQDKKVSRWGPKIQETDQHGTAQDIDYRATPSKPQSGRPVPVSVLCGEHKTSQFPQLEV